MTAVLCGVLLTAVLLVRYCVLRTRMRQLRMENQRLRQAVQLGQHRSQALEGQLNALRELRHDLRHYLQGTEPSPQLEQLLHTPLPSADVFSAMADRYRQQAEALGADVDLRLSTRSVPQALLPDVYLILSNLLENAVEALEREPGGWLKVRSIAAPGYLSLVVGNSSHGALRTVGGTYLSSKARGRLGIGLQTVRRIAQQYGGEAEFSADGEAFRASVFLPFSPAVSTPAAESETADTPRQS